MSRHTHNKETDVGKTLRAWTPEDVSLKPDEACRVIHLSANIIDDLVAKLQKAVGANK